VQVALLASLPQNPSRFDPIAHADLAATRRRYVLKSLAGGGVISNAEEARAEADDTESTVVPTPAACP